MLQTLVAGRFVFLQLLMLAGFAVFVKPDKQVVILDVHDGTS
jgi:hypothetical protein